MAKPEVLARVDADLDRGHTHLATQRLNSLIAQDPYDLGLRARLAAVHRRTGNHAGAGRWGYLTEDVSEAELTAFAKAYYCSAADQLRALVLRGETPPGLGPLAGARLAALTAKARSTAAAGSPRTTARSGAAPIAGIAAYVPPPAPRPKPPPPDSPSPRGDAVVGAIMILILLGFTVIGVVTVIRWIL
ncbi:DUF6584 family protein [Actinoplanes xinjiangensis]|jgi:hypothetical protein|uniref:Uncharacterized protein n=1 Tax=Actinoplanes xinjiangensis TaxID=512350 RepID=A0A316FW09_9ACTN|nr:DUF6584 family protein [Actinoplanes xinjiangensis]PWK52512.1 hypothetical protein BC793_101521 [Actinoplanes xinjiangensis]GIF36789.1 hypothetical protein Axi01nite_11000 [Actinoplanes xinjiangensis]